jgi:hypothetical protein
LLRIVRIFAQATSRHPPIVYSQQRTSHFLSDDEANMRAALCIFAVLVGFTNAGHAQNSKYKKPAEKPIQLPSVDLLKGYTGNFSADESHVWRTQDPSNQFRTQQSASQPYFGLTFKRSLD